MNFNKIFVFFALIIIAFMGQTEAGWLRKIGKKIVSFIFKRSLINELLIKFVFYSNRSVLVNILVMQPYKLLVLLNKRQMLQQQ